MELTVFDPAPVRPTRSLVLIRADPTRDERSGVILLDITKTRERIGTVIACGPQVHPDTGIVPGARVFFGYLVVYTFEPAATIDGHLYVMAEADEITLKLNDSELDPIHIINEDTSCI